MVYKADYSQPEGDGFEDTLYTVAVKTLKGEEVWLDICRTTGITCTPFC